MNKSPTDRVSQPGLSRPAYRNQTAPAALPALPRLAYTMRETAQLLGCNYQTVFRLSKRGLLRSSSALRTKMFPVVEIERFLRDTSAK
jgi:hypothetical protein